MTISSDPLADQIVDAAISYKNPKLQLLTMLFFGSNMASKTHLGIHMACCRLIKSGHTLEAKNLIQQCRVHKRFAINACIYQSVAHDLHDFAIELISFHRDEASQKIIEHDLLHNPDNFTFIYRLLNQQLNAESPLNMCLKLLTYCEAHFTDSDMQVLYKKQLNFAASLAVEYQLLGDQFHSKSNQLKDTHPEVIDDFHQQISLEINKREMQHLNLPTNATTYRNLS